MPAGALVTAMLPYRFGGINKSSLFVYHAAERALRKLVARIEQMDIDLPGFRRARPRLQQIQNDNGAHGEELFALPDRVHF
jgi:hypothetical protein